MYLGSDKINKIRLGSTEVKKVYQGSDLVWQNRGPFSFDFSTKIQTGIPSYLLDYYDLYFTRSSVPGGTGGGSSFVRGYYLYPDGGHYLASDAGLNLVGHIILEPGVYRISGSILKSSNTTFRILHSTTLYTTLDSLNAASAIKVISTGTAGDYSVDITVTESKKFVIFHTKNFSASGADKLKITELTITPLD